MFESNEGLEINSAFSVMLPSKNVRQVSSPRHIKRPMNCFMVWSKEKRCQILKHNPGINNAEVSKALGVAWKRLSTQEKKPYVEKARKLSEQHMEENPNYKYKPKRRKEVSLADKVRKSRSAAPWSEQERNKSEATTLQRPSSMVTFPQNAFHTSNLPRFQQQLALEIRNPGDFPLPSPALFISQATSPTIFQNFDMGLLARRRHELMLEHERRENRCGSNREVHCLTSLPHPAQPFSFEQGAAPPSSQCPCHLRYPMGHPSPPSPPYLHQFPTGYTLVEGNVNRHLDNSLLFYDCRERADIIWPYNVKHPSYNGAKMFCQHGWENNA